MTSLSIFDVDRTITRRPTYSLFLLFAQERIAPWRIILTPLLLPVALAYVLKLIRRERMKEAMHRVALGSRVAGSDIRAAAEEFAERLIDAGLYPEAVALIQREAAEGRRVMLATAAPVLYIEPLARRLGVADAVATRGIWRGDTLTYRIAGRNCYGMEKRIMIAEALKHAGIDRNRAHIRFFTDHASDRPVCEWADEAFAVNPSPRMARLAVARGWRILDWRGA